jgi:hypothetical protein
MVVRVNRLPIQENQVNEFDYHDAEIDHIGQEDLNYDQTVDDETKSFDGLKNEINRQFSPEIVNDDDHEFQFRVKKSNGSVGNYKIVKFYLKNDDEAPMYGVYKYDDSFDGFDLLHDEIGSRALDNDQAIAAISQDLQS